MKRFTNRERMLIGAIATISLLWLDHPLPAKAGPVWEAFRWSMNTITNYRLGDMNRYIDQAAYNYRYGKGQVGSYQGATATPTTGPGDKDETFQPITRGNGPGHLLA